MKINQQTDFAEMAIVSFHNRSSHLQQFFPPFRRSCRNSCEANASRGLWLDRILVNDPLLQPTAHFNFKKNGSSKPSHNQHQHQHWDALQFRERLALDEADPRSVRPCAQGAGALLGADAEKLCDALRPELQK